ncbi:sensor histidine kinase [Neobacillus ginsengisoli]|uniref:histidine kinase n=1 Tax=Neobacillus ginsengisoli TaxID=904295 RepID=A0ABT9Y2N7_9BACI|nr:sensor histidine kinase [Neobacillus ginsengisoli]MDQ0201913.1 two-component system sensor histidine kinase YcbA [Neobacillus ginsengisoli]
MIIAVPITGELKFYPLSGADLRFSMSTTVFFFILLWSRKIHPVLAGFLTGSAVVCFRIILDKVQVGSFDFPNHFPVFFYYMVFGMFFHILKVKKLYHQPLLIGLLGMVLEIMGNFTEMTIRHFTIDMKMTTSSFLIIVGVAIIRSFFVLGFFNTILVWETRLAEEQQRKRTEEILLLVSNLYVEMFQLEKSAKDAENLTSTCYAIYRDLKALNNPNQAQAILKIAGELHEIKKDNQRIYAGLSKLMAKEKLDDFMNIREIISVATISNKNYSELLGKTIDFQVRISGEHPEYRTFILLSLINNLIANAVEAIHQEGQIVVTVKRVQDLVKITIKDNGNGISEKNKVYIFEPGFTTKFDQAGIASNGIGLSYTKNVIENLDGNIHLIESSKEKGTTFEIQLPVLKLMKKG